MTLSTIFSTIPEAPNDPILGVSEKFIADINPQKVNLGVGVYQNADGKSLKLTVVRKAEELIFAGDIAAGYGPIDGSKEYNQHTQTLLFGADSEVVKSCRAATIQSPGGTGAIRLGAELIKLFFNKRDVLISNPSWDNHRSIFEAADLPVQLYPYYDSATRGFDYAGCINTLNNAKDGSVILLHVCCHNPTGYDFTKEQWKEIHALVLKKNFIPFLDFAYQGFSDGISEDTFAVNLFTESRTPFFIANSYSKNFGLYAERTGALTVVAQNKKEADVMRSQVKRIVRTIYSNPPARGAKIVNAVFSDSSLRSEWEAELTAMRTRMKQMRTAFVEQLAKSGIEQDFSHIASQKGMFSFSGLSREVVLWLREHRGVYALESGRICIAAINTKNLEYVCDSIAAGIKAAN